MAIPRLPDPSNPESIGAADFDTRRRGFDPMQVRAYLKVLARELARLREREAELQTVIVDARGHAPPVAEFDEERATVLLGEETTRVLAAARGAAADKLTRTGEQAREIIEAAQAEAAEIRSGAHAAVDNELAAARAEGRAIIAEAKLVRERMLEDLAAKRHAMRAQLEQLRAGRDRLAESYSQIRRLLDDVSGTLDEALPHAQMAARRAAERAASQPIPSAASIEREIDDAARAGMPLVTRGEVEAEAGTDVVADTDDEPADWVNAGAPPTQNEPAVELFGEWDEAEAEFFLGADPTLGAIERVAVIIDADVAEKVDAAAADPAEPAEPEPVEPEPVEPEPEPRGIMLAEVTRSRRDAGLPRVAVPILEPPDAIEVVRVFREDAAPEPGSHRAEPEVSDPPPVEPAVEETIVETIAPPTVRSPRVAEFSPVTEPAPEEPESSDTPVVAVDDLFARIRRTREEKVARAEEVLRSALFPTAIDGEREAAPVAEPEPVVIEPFTPEPFTISGDRLGAALADDAERFAERERVLAPLQLQIARKIKRLLADEQNDVLDLVRRSHGRVDHEDVMPPADAHAGRYVAAVGGELLSAVGAGASFFADGAGADGADLASLDACVADELVSPLRALLERALAGEAVEDEVLDRMRTAYREVKSRHVDDAAFTIALASFNTGVEAAHAGHLVRWAVDPVHGCSPDCDDNALEGPIEVGTAFPTGATRPPGHAGCRCLLVPVQQ